MIDECSDISKLSWDKIYNLNMYEFLNYINYSRYKNKKLSEQIKNKYGSKTY